jgi:AcrR family transcriptional regulator
MEEVARAAGFSRQGVYFYYPSKEELFRGTILYVYESRLKEAETALADRCLSLRERLGKALDAWYGRYIGTVQAGASDLVESSGLHAAEIVKTFEERLDAMLVRALSAEKELTRAYRSVKVQPPQIARVLHAAAQGLKDTCQRREDFLNGVNAASALICAYPGAVLRGPRH